MPAPQFIYHIADNSSWLDQSDESVYSIDTLDTEGFIHCSRLEQLQSTLNRFFENREDICILKIDTKQLHVPLIYEAADDGSGFFPHVFGPVRKSSITEVYNFPFDFINQDPQKADEQAP
ncbi:MAG: DUF952 domain-containing protein [Bacteroidetes bacterium]|nr:DUF952 domain-containing protein [Bacteroidota bacterium]